MRHRAAKSWATRKCLFFLNREGGLALALLGKEMRNGKERGVEIEDLRKPANGEFCEAHRVRANVQIPASIIVDSTPMCRSCFAGKPISVSRCRRCGRVFNPGKGRRHCDRKCAWVMARRRFRARHPKSPTHRRCRRCGALFDRGGTTRIYCQTECFRLHRLKTRREAYHRRVAEKSRTEKPHSCFLDRLPCEQFF